MDGLAVDTFPIGGAFVVGEGVEERFPEGGTVVGEGGGGGAGGVDVVVEDGVAGSAGYGAALLPLEVVPVEVVHLVSACFIVVAGGRGLIAGPPGLETEHCGFGGGIVGARGPERLGGWVRLRHGGCVQFVNLLSSC